MPAMAWRADSAHSPRSSRSSSAARANRSCSARYLAADASKIFARIFPRSALSDSRNFRNWPWASMTICPNWFASRPSSSTILDVTADAPVTGARPSSQSVAFGDCATYSSEFLLFAKCCDRSTRHETPPCSNHSPTSVSTDLSAKSLCSISGVRRPPLESP